MHIQILSRILRVDLTKNFETLFCSSKEGTAIIKLLIFAGEMWGTIGKVGLSSGTQRAFWQGIGWNNHQIVPNDDDDFVFVDAVDVGAVSGDDDRDDDVFNQVETFPCCVLL